METIPLSLYIHFPWCKKKCPYCDFNSLEIQSDTSVSEYVSVLESDLKSELVNEKRKKLVSIFLGGGTPSLIPGSELNVLFRIIANEFELLNTEITIEANPGSSEFSNFYDYKLLGINRLSIGAQTFNERTLKKLGRIHNSSDIKNAFDLARRAHFNNINIDIMYGLPNQTISEAIDDLEKTIALDPEHISWYELTLEPNTVFFKNPPKVPSEIRKERMFELGKEKLLAAGYHQYEISAYAKPGNQSKHNTNYWEFGDYLGIGAGAHGKLTKANIVNRTKKTRNPKDYLKNRHSIVKKVDPEELVIEFLMNALRLIDGFELSLFEKRCHQHRSNLKPFLLRALEKNLIEVKRDRVTPTKKGSLFLNELVLLA